MKRLFTTVALAGLLATGAVYAQSTMPSDASSPNSPRAGNPNNPAGTMAPGASDSRMNSGDSGTASDPADGTSSPTAPKHKATTTTKKDVGAYRPNGTASTSPPEPGSGPGTAEPANK